MTNPKQTSGQANTDARSITEQDINLEWYDVPGYDGFYQITKCGKVRSLDRIVIGRYKKRIKGVILNPVLISTGYLGVILCKHTKRKTKGIHRLLAETFIPNPKNLPQVNHIDENKLNNSLDNLEWCTSQYNTEYSCAKTYKAVSPDGEMIEFFNLSKFCRDNNLDLGNMHKVLTGETNMHRGWTRPCGL